MIALGTAMAHAEPLVAGPEKSVVSGNQEPDFDRDVAPIFQAKCLKCHGEKERKAELDLRTIAALLKGGESGAVIVPKDPDKSLLYEKVLEGEMPPAKKDRLSEAEVATIRRWIESGARGSAKPGADEADGSKSLNQHDVIPIL